MVSQMRRAALSVSANLAEGYHRRTIKDSVNFYYIATASLEELKFYLLICRDLNYLDAVTFNKVEKEAEEVGKLLGAG